jgi:hypothetical protein
VSGDLISREECQEEKRSISDSFIRIHERVDKIETTTAEIKVSAKNIEGCVCRIEKIMYGDQNSDGVLAKVSNMKQKVEGLFWFGGITITALVTSLVGILIAIIFKTK